jgi:hypothetical protein
MEPQWHDFTGVLFVDVHGAEEADYDFSHGQQMMDCCVGH